MLKGASLSTRSGSSESTETKFGVHASAILLGACILGLVSVFLPAIKMSIFGMSESIAVIKDWRGKLGLVAYVAVGVMALQMMSAKMITRKQVVAVLATSITAVLLAVLLLASVSSAGSKAESAIAKELMKNSVKIGFGCYVNILAALVMFGGAMALAKHEKVV